MADTVKCDGCGKDSGQTERPEDWYERFTPGDVRQYACSPWCVGTVANRNIHYAYGRRVREADFPQ